MENDEYWIEITIKNSKIGRADEQKNLNRWLRRLSWIWKREPSFFVLKTTMAGKQTSWMISGPKNEHNKGTIWEHDFLDDKYQ